MTNLHDALTPFVGEWSMVAVFEKIPPVDAGARVSFDWLPGEQFLIERWEVPVPEAPDGIAIIARIPSAKATPSALLRLARRRARVQDERRGWRVEAVASRAGLLATRLLPALHRHLQRGRQDHCRRVGNCHDGTTWEHDFDLTYTRA